MEQIPPDPERPLQPVPVEPLGDPVAVLEAAVGEGTEGTREDTSGVDTDFSSDDSQLEYNVDAANGIVMEGYLFKRASNAFKTWNRFLRVEVQKHLVTFLNVSDLFIISLVFDVIENLNGILSLLEHGEEYTFSLPCAYARSILTVPWVELGGKVSVNCAKTGYSASITFHTKPFYGGKLHRLYLLLLGSDTFRPVGLEKSLGKKKRRTPRWGMSGSPESEESHLKPALDRKKIRGPLVKERQ
ncbi:hypothetical protein STEG23_036386 [Scotinomys teguina]